MIPLKAAKVIVLVLITIIVISFVSLPTPKVPTNLVILPCHSVYVNPVDSDKIITNAGADADSWLLAPFQLEANDQLSFLDHLERCKTLIEKRADHAVLMLSGGFTKPQVELSEAQSYFNVGLQRGWFTEDMLNRSVFLEEFARDSYENVLFSLAKFYKLYNNYPEVVTIVGFGFKEPRFVQLHLQTLGYKGDRAEYIGIGPDFPPKPPSESNSLYKQRAEKYYKELSKSEKKFAYDLFLENPFGSQGSTLHRKKISRDPWKKSAKISAELMSGSQPLNALIEIDSLNLDKAMAAYNKFVVPHLPFE